MLPGILPANPVGTLPKIHVPDLQTRCSSTLQAHRNRDLDGVTQGQLKLLRHLVLRRYLEFGVPLPSQAI